jgi:hypothetical protein
MYTRKWVSFNPVSISSKVAGRVCGANNVKISGIRRLPTIGTLTLEVFSCVLSEMQREEQHRNLSRRHKILVAYMALHSYDEDIETSVAILSELKRLVEQIELQWLARIRIWTSSFNINSLSDLQCLQRYRFRRKDVCFIAGLIPWENGLDLNVKMRTSQKRYLVDP